MVADDPQCYPMDDITVRTPYFRSTFSRRDNSWHAYLKGYARVVVDQVEKRWEDLDLKIPEGDGEEELGQGLSEQAVHRIFARNHRFRNISSEVTSRRKGPQHQSAVTGRTKVPQHGMTIIGLTNGS